MNKERREELSELVRDRWVFAITTFSFSPSTIILLLTNIAGRSYILFLSVYIIIILFTASNSAYVILAQKKTPTVNIPGKPSSEKWIAKYPLLTPFARMGLILAVLLIPVFSYIPPFNDPVNIFVNGTPTPIPTQTLTLTPSPTITITPSPKPISDSLYYMIVYDSSSKMDESFHGQRKWQVARNLLVEIINGLNPRAQYSLVVVGGSTSSDSMDPCDNPASPAVAFSPRQGAYNYLGGLQPQGGGSFYRAYTLAKNQLEDLPKETIRTLIYITGSSDACETEDEWKALKNLISFPDSTFGIFSQIIILDDDGIRSQTLADQFNSLSNDNINAQAPQSISEIQNGGVTVVHIVKNVTDYVNTTIASFPTNAPLPTSANTSILIPNSGITLPPQVEVPTGTPSFTPILAPTRTPSVTPSITPIPPAYVVLQLPIDYRTTGIGCQVDVMVNISGNAAKGAFHVRNDFFAPGASDVYPQTNLPIGTYYAGTVDVNNLLTLGGDQSAYYQHEIWFEYDGTESNHLTGVTCPGVP